MSALSNFFLCFCTHILKVKLCWLRVNKLQLFEVLFLLSLLSSLALKYSAALCQQKCKRKGTPESHYCSSNFGKRSPLQLILTFLLIYEDPHTHKCKVRWDHVGGGQQSKWKQVLIVHILCMFFFQHAIFGLLVCVSVFQKIPWAFFCHQHSGFVCRIQCSCVNRLQWTVGKLLVNGSVDSVELFGRSRCPWNRSAMFMSRSELIFHSDFCCLLGFAYRELLWSVESRVTLRNKNWMWLMVENYMHIKSNLYNHTLYVPSKLAEMNKHKFRMSGWKYMFK